MLATAPDFTPHVGRTRSARITPSAGRDVAAVGPRHRHPPARPFRVAIEAINEDPGVHVADTGAVTPPVVSLATAPQPPRPWSPAHARPMPDDVNKMIVSWQPAAGADHYLVEQGPGDGTWTRMASLPPPASPAWPSYSNATMIRVAAVGLHARPVGRNGSTRSAPDSCGT